MEHRSVRRRAAAEVVALHDALEALAAADADHVDAIAVVEDAVDEHLVAGLERVAARRELHLAAHARRRHAGLLVVPAERLARLAPASLRPARAAPLRSRRSARVFACTTTHGPALITVAGGTVPSGSKTWVMPIFLPMIPVTI